MYQALYRKYRPQTLDDVCGQDVIVKIIKNSIQNNQINHAYLFAGPRGTGKTSIAKILAKIINCENPNGYKPCGKCLSCTTQNNSDIVEIDAASNNGVDEIRELRNKVNLLPAYGKYKVYIIDEVHMLTPGAFNALLKTLEEPPAHVIFILATTDPHKVIETIQSRCQRLDFKKISDDAIVDNLKKIAQKEKIDIDENALKEIAHLADGGMRDSVGMLDQARAYTEGKITEEDIHDINGTITEENLTELISNIKQSNLDKILETIDKYNDNGKNFIKLLEELINFLRNTLLYKEAPNYVKSKQNNISNYEKTSKNLTTDELFNYIEILSKYSLEMKNSSNTKLLFELALIKIITKDNQNVENSSKINEKPEKIENKEEINIKKTQKNVKKTTKNPEKSDVGAPNNLKKETIKPSSKTNEIDISKLSSETKQELDKKIEEIKKIRVDNTLSKFNKAKMKEILPYLENLNDLLNDKDYSNKVSIILDGTLKAASDDNLIFVYRTQRLALLFNENLISLEETIKKILNKKYDLIAVDTDEWEIIKKDFNQKLRPFTYQKETKTIENIFKEIIQKQKITNIFEDIVEYK